MSDVLLIGRNSEYLEEWRTALRKAKFDVVNYEDIIEGMRELNWLRPEIIIWDIVPGKLLEIKALSTLRQRFPGIPLLLVVDNGELAGVLNEMANGYISRVVNGDKLTSRVLEMVGPAKPKKRSHHSVEDTGFEDYDEYE